MLRVNRFETKRRKEFDRVKAGNLVSTGAIRNCLSCSYDFNSESIGNRICDVCKRNREQLGVKFRERLRNKGK